MSAPPDDERRPLGTDGDASSKQASSAYQRAGRALWRGGWQPIPVGGKHKPVAGFTGRDGRTVGWDDLNRWIDSTPEGFSNVAVRLQASLVGVDVDAYDGRQGARTLELAVAELGPLPPTISTTSRGPGQPSRISLYRVPPGTAILPERRTFGARFGPDVDVIRCEHRYAMVWPSRHPTTGEEYRWYGADGAALDDVPAMTEAARLPPKWLEFMSAPAVVSSPDEVNETEPVASVPQADGRGNFFAPARDHRFTPDEANRYVEPVLKALDNAQRGEVNDRLNDAAFMIGHFVAGDFITAEKATQTLLKRQLKPWHDNDETQARRTIRDGLKAGARDWAAILVPEAESAELIDPEATIDKRFPVLDWKALFADDSAEEWIVEPLLPARRLIAVYSAPKVGKSLLILELAVAVSRGTEILGVVPDRPRRVLYVDYENDPRGDVRQRLEAMGIGPDDLENLLYLSFPTMGGLDTAAGAAELIAAVEHYACEVVIVDTVSRAVRGEENDNDTWLSFYRNTGLALKQRGVAMLRLDHSGKDEARGQRGGSAKVGDVDAVWRLDRKAEGTFRLTCEANRMPVAEKEIVLTRLTEPVLRHKVEGGGWMAEADAVVAEIVAAADRAGLPADAGRDRVTAAGREAGIRASTGRYEEAVRRRKPAPGRSAGSSGHSPAPGRSGQDYDFQA